MDLPDKSKSTPGTPQTGTERRKVDQVVQGVSLVKRPATRRFKDFLLAESPKVLIGRIARDTLWPRAKAAVEESANAFLAGMFWGDGSSRPVSGMVRGTVLQGGVQTYHGIQPMMGGNPIAQAMMANTARSSGNYQDILCPTQQVAEKLLANMFDLLNRYNVVTVADLYEAAGIKPQISDGSYGWSSLDGARIVKARNGFLLELPSPTIL